MRGTWFRRIALAALGALCCATLPLGALTGELKKSFKIDPAVCIRCGACAAACRFGAVRVD